MISTPAHLTPYAFPLRVSRKLWVPISIPKAYYCTRTTAATRIRKQSLRQRNVNRLNHFNTCIL